MRTRRYSICLAALLAFCGNGSSIPGQSHKASVHVGVPMCTPDQLSLGTDDENGNFDGMSHSGTLLVLRNLGSNACRISTTPQIALYSKNDLLNVKFTLTAAAAVSRAQFVIVAAGAELTSSLRWVSSDVYDPGVCVNATSLHLGVPAEDYSAKRKRMEHSTAPVHVVLPARALSTDIDNQLCGQRGKPIDAEMTALATDPVYRPGKPTSPGS